MHNQPNAFYYDQDQQVEILKFCTEMLWKMDDRHNPDGIRKEYRLTKNIELPEGPANVGTPAELENRQRKFFRFERVFEF